MNNSERLILVDESDRAWGDGLKLDVHRFGVLHRAFSIFIWNNTGQLLLQKRAQVKYHSGGLWANSCCGHPCVGESVHDAAYRRLYEELGIKTALNHIGNYRYRADLPGELIENEFVHIFAGRTDDVPSPNPEEVETIKWVAPDMLIQDIGENRHDYSAWFQLYVANLSDLVLSCPAIFSSTK
jgi:isopentenyl-diphosphate Delta-isomerase